MRNIHFGLPLVRLLAISGPELVVKALLVCLNVHPAETHNFMIRRAFTKAKKKGAWKQNFQAPEY